jgi:hypothetical protein
MEYPQTVGRIIEERPERIFITVMPGVFDLGAIVGVARNSCAAKRSGVDF